MYLGLHSYFKNSPYKVHPVWIEATIWEKVPEPLKLCSVGKKGLLQGNINTLCSSQLNANKGNSRLPYEEIFDQMKAKGTHVKQYDHGRIRSCSLKSYSIQQLCHAMVESEDLLSYPFKGGIGICSINFESETFLSRKYLNQQLYNLKKTRRSFTISKRPDGALQSHKDQKKLNRSSEEMNHETASLVHTRFHHLIVKNIPKSQGTKNCQPIWSGNMT